MFLNISISTIDICSFFQKKDKRILNHSDKIFETCLFKSNHANLKWIPLVPRYQRMRMDGENTTDSFRSSQCVR